MTPRERQLSGVVAESDLDMTERTCAVCGVDIEHKQRSAKTCSPECGVKRQNAKRYKRPKRECPACGVDITTRQGQVKYCSNACRRWIANGNTGPRQDILECAHCGKPFPRNGTRQKHCSLKCNQAAANKRRAHRDPDRYLAERDRRIAYAIAYAKANPHVGKAARTKRKQRIREAGGPGVSSRDWLRLCKRHFFRCYYCGQQCPLTMDHVVPLSRGGRHSIGNVLPACQPCNSSKRTRFLSELRKAGWARSSTGEASTPNALRQASVHRLTHLPAHPHR